MVNTIHMTLAKISPIHRGFPFSVPHLPAITGWIHNILESHIIHNNKQYQQCYVLISYSLTIKRFLCWLIRNQRRFQAKINSSPHYQY